MFLVVKIPEYPLRTFIKSIIYYRGYSADCHFEMLLPDSSSQLIIALDENTRTLHPPSLCGNTPLSFKKFWITGIQTKPVIYTAEKNATTLCIQFDHGGLNALLNIPAYEFQDKMFDASLIMGQKLSIFREKLLMCHHHTQIIDMTMTFLEKRLLNPFEKLKLSSFVIKKMCDEQQTLFQVSKQLGYSQKHLIHKFKTAVGVTPKKFQKIFRFNKTLLLMQRSKSIDYADIVFDCHYFDQAHFINDFRSMAYRSPSQYLQIKKDYPHVLPLHSLR